MNGPAEQPRYAGFWIRALAEMIDSTILTVASCGIQLAFMAPIYAIKVSMQHSRGQAALPFWDAFDPLWLQLVNAGLYVLVAFPYYVIGHYRYGTTLGKRPLRVYVVQAGSLERITLRQSILRFFGYLVSYLPFGAGYLMAGFHPQKRALHDLIAGTVSVYRAQPLGLPAAKAAVGTEVS